MPVCWAVVSRSSDTGAGARPGGLALCCGLFYGATVVTAYAVNPDPPATRIFEKSPEYTVFYVETWKDRSHARRVKHAWIGFGIGMAAVLGGTLLACGLYGGCDFGGHF